ncbi:recombinase family protein, partial [Aeromonas hydrophila]
MTDAKRIAYSYIRLSSKAQVDGDGIRRQTELAREYCTANNLTISTKSFKDLGISAFKERARPSLADLLECIQNGTIQEGDTIILEKLDRLSRKGIDDTIHQLRSILQHGVELVSLMDNLRLSRNSLNDLISIIRIAVASDLARQESETKSKRVRENKAAMKKLAANGIATRKRLPMWLTYSDPDHKYVLNDNADVVLRMFELRENGVALGEIARRLNAEDVPTPNNRKWVASTVSMILGSVSLYGAYQTLDRQQDGSYTKGKVIRDYYPVLVPYERWKPVQSSAVRIAGGHSKINHLSGLCFCVCGGAISFKKNNAQRKTKATYHYCRKHAFGTCDNRHCVRDLEKLVIKYSNRLDVENVPVSDTNSHG